MQNNNYDKKADTFIKFINLIRINAQNPEVLTNMAKYMYSKFDEKMFESFIQLNWEANSKGITFEKKVETKKRKLATIEIISGSQDIINRIKEIAVTYKGKLEQIDRQNKNIMISLNDLRPLSETQIKNSFNNGNLKDLTLIYLDKHFETKSKTELFTTILSINHGYYCKILRDIYLDQKRQKNITCTFDEFYWQINDKNIGSYKNELDHDIKIYELFRMAPFLLLFFITDNREKVSLKHITKHMTDLREYLNRDSQFIDGKRFQDEEFKNINNLIPISILKVLPNTFINSITKNYVPSSFEIPPQIPQFNINQNSIPQQQQNTIPQQSNIIDQLSDSMKQVNLHPSNQNGNSTTFSLNDGTNEMIQKTNQQGENMEDVLLENNGETEWDSSSLEKENDN